MFTLVTGTPGACKTSTTLEKLKAIKDRPVFYRGIRLTEEGKKVFSNWQELTDEEATHWHEHVPDKAIIVIDEVQQLFPVRGASKPVPSGLTALETHRHHAWDVYFITQEPGLLDSHARKIANEHFHYIRPFGAPFITEYHSGTGAIAPSNRTDLSRCAQKKRGLPKSVFGLYVSAEEHTHKFRPPKLLFVLAALVIAAALFWGYFFTNFSLGGVDPEAVKQTAEAGPVTRGQPVTERVRWGKLFEEEIRGFPFTSPLYREKAMEVQSVPVVHGCMTFQADYSDCKCYTQQGNKIPTIGKALCRQFIRDGGLFNHMVADADLGYPKRGQRSGGGEGRDTTRAAPETSL